MAEIEPSDLLLGIMVSFNAAKGGDMILQRRRRTDIETRVLVSESRALSREYFIIICFQRLSLTLERNLHYLGAQHLFFQRKT